MKRDKLIEAVKHLDAAWSAMVDANKEDDTPQWTRDGGDWQIRCQIVGLRREIMNRHGITEGEVI